MRPLVVATVALLLATTLSPRDYGEVSAALAPATGLDHLAFAPVFFDLGLAPMLLLAGDPP